jgi:hypothetical protein
MTLWRISHRGFSCGEYGDYMSAIIVTHRDHTPGDPQLIPPGRCRLFLRSQELWVTSWPFPHYIPPVAESECGDRWMNTCFRQRPGTYARLEDLIDATNETTRWRWPTEPTCGVTAFVDRSKFPSKGRDYGRCYLRDDFKILAVVTDPNATLHKCEVPVRKRRAKKDQIEMFA